MPPTGTYNAPLWDFTGYQSWPAFTTFFEWDPGDASIPGDRVFLFDASVAENIRYARPEASIAEIEDLANKMQKMLDLSDEARASFGLSSRDKAMQQFDENIVIGHYLDVIGELEQPAA